MARCALATRGDCAPRALAVGFDLLLAAVTYVSLLARKSGVGKLAVQPPQIAPQILGAADHIVAQPVAECSHVKPSEAIENKRGKFVFWRGVASLVENSEMVHAEVSNLPENANLLAHSDYSPS